jgi:membrane peptidoglycan carboxypeptidase
VALVAVEPGTGYLKAIIGGRSYAESQFNRAVDARRQPGSTIKPLIYALALEAGNYPLSTQHCTETNFAAAGAERYAPRDFGTKPYHEDDLTMRRALAESCNVTALNWLQVVGAQNVVDLARRTGISSPLSPTPSLALGCYEVSPLEMAGMYATFAAGGVYQQPVAVVKLVGPDGRVIDEHKPEPQRAMSSGAAYIVTDMLKGVLQAGGTGARIGSRLTRPAAAKTGSTEGSRDAWFAGYTPDLALVVWVGFDDNAALSGGGAALAGPVWRDALEKGLPAASKRDFARPADVVTAHVCNVSGRLTNWTCQGESDLFVAGSAPAEYCGLFHWDNVLGTGGRSPVAPPAAPGTGNEPQQPPASNTPWWRRPKKR